MVESLSVVWLQSATVQTKEDTKATDSVSLGFLIEGTTNSGMEATCPELQGWASQVWLWS